MSSGAGEFALAKDLNDQAVPNEIISLGTSLSLLPPARN
jgi:hypothetical protein